MKLDLALRWLGGAPDGSGFDPRLLPLLKAIRDHGSLKQAASRCEISYRLAWDLLGKSTDLFGQPLVVLQRGKGARLSKLGENLLYWDQAISARLAPQLSSLAREINDDLQKILHPRVNEQVVRFHASHDLALAEFQVLLREAGWTQVECQTHGSVASLSQLLLGTCDIAGFHFPRGALASSLKHQYEGLLSNHNFRLLQLAIRSQGLMTAPGNPRHVKGTGDLSRRSLRFINRQEGSGTRIILDALLEETGIDRSRIKGYLNEEFTHLAVAAMLASGAADLGFGIKAAADRFGLHFIPIVEENYVLAFSNAVPEKLFRDIRRLLVSDKFSRKLTGLAGYRKSNTGKLLSVAKLLEGK